ncbi:hypothetical protein [Endozoicomonas lisbonensis]|uniref:hypothetical protein n=1 Tax=Endozoicomonas lisbonensis TaxID=3120522 RepID=UPI0033911936
MYKKDALPEGRKPFRQAVLNALEFGVGGNQPPLAVISGYTGIFLIGIRDIRINYFNNALKN